MILSSLALVATAQAAELCVPYTGDVDYECIALKLEAYNSSYYPDLSKEEIDGYLYSCKTTFHDEVVRAAKACVREARER